MMDRYIHLRQAARDVFQLRYQDSIREDQSRWETCTRVLAGGTSSRSSPAPGEPA